MCKLGVTNGALDHRGWLGSWPGPKGPLPKVHCVVKGDDVLGCFLQARFCPDGPAWSSRPRSSGLVPACVRPPLRPYRGPITPFLPDLKTVARSSSPLLSSRAVSSAILRVEARPALREGCSRPAARQRRSLSLSSGMHRVRKHSSPLGIHMSRISVRLRRASGGIAGDPRGLRSGRLAQREVGKRRFGCADRSSGLGPSSRRRW